MFICLFCTTEVKILLPMCLHHPHFLIFLFFKYNIVVIKGKVQVHLTLRMTTAFYSCCFLCARFVIMFATYLFSFQRQLDAQYNLQPAFLRRGRGEWGSLFCQSRKRGLGSGVFLIKTQGRANNSFLENILKFPALPSPQRKTYLP